MHSSEKKKLKADSETLVFSLLIRESSRESAGRLAGAEGWLISRYQPTEKKKTVGLLSRSVDVEVVVSEVLLRAADSNLVDPSACSMYREVTPPLRFQQGTTSLRLLCARNKQRENNQWVFSNMHIIVKG